MPAIVTLNVFSGRPNPSWCIGDKHIDVILERVEASSKVAINKPIGAAGLLGYRGLSVRFVDHPGVGDSTLYVQHGVIDRGQFEPSRVTDTDFERFLLETGEAAIDGAVLEFVHAELQNPTMLEIPELFLVAAGGCPACNAADAPSYNPGRWNDGGAVQLTNNCYNYANDQITNTFAQPGRAAGKPIQALQCVGNPPTRGAQPAAQADGLAPVGGFGGNLGAGQGWYVALVIWPGIDYHWYRQDDNGCWSHKPGRTAARNTDNSGNQITDPQTCDRGPYVNFCTYMITRRGLAIR